eukprot:354589_1
MDRVMSLLNSILSSRKLKMGIMCLIVYPILRYTWIKIQRKLYKQPYVGPLGYPVFGSMFSLMFKGHQFYMDIYKSSQSQSQSQSQSKLISFSLGITPIICINDPIVAKQILSQKYCDSRPEYMFGQSKCLPITGISSVEEWKKRRRGFQSNLMTLLLNHNIIE